VLGSLNESERVWFAAPRNETEFPASSELSKEFAFQEAANFPTHSSETIFWSDAVTILANGLSQHDWPFFGPARNALQTHACREQALGRQWRRRLAVRLFLDNP